MGFSLCERTRNMWLFKELYVVLVVIMKRFKKSASVKTKSHGFTFVAIAPVVPDDFVENCLKEKKFLLNIDVCH